MHTPRGWKNTNDRHKNWRRGVVFVIATGFPNAPWLNTGVSVSIRPKETGAEAYERLNGQPLSKDDYVLWRDF